MTAPDWSVCESDEEWNQYNIPVGLDVKAEQYIPQNTDHYIPKKLALLFKDIQEKKILPVTCSCPRTGSNDSDLSKTSPNEQQRNQNVEKNQIVTPEEQREKETKEAVDTSKGYEAFEFDDDNDDRGPASAKRKTPGSNVKRAKKDKVGSLTNVVNDIRRQKLLDEIEAAKDEENTSADKSAPPK